MGQKDCHIPAPAVAVSVQVVEAVRPVEVVQWVHSFVVVLVAVEAVLVGKCPAVMQLAVEAVLDRIVVKIM